MTSPRPTPRLRMPSPHASPPFARRAYGPVAQASPSPHAPGSRWSGRTAWTRSSRWDRPPRPGPCRPAASTTGPSSPFRWTRGAISKPAGLPLRYDGDSWLTTLPRRVRPRPASPRPARQGPRRRGRRVLAAWAANGPNDVGGPEPARRGAAHRSRRAQSPSSPSSAWRAIAGDHGAARRGHRALVASRSSRASSARSRARRSVRAQVGFNNNVKYKSQTSTSRPRTAASTSRTSSPTSSPTAAASSRATSARTPSTCRRDDVAAVRAPADEGPAARDGARRCARAASTRSSRAAPSAAWSRSTTRRRSTSRSSRRRRRRASRPTARPAGPRAGARRGAAARRARDPARAYFRLDVLRSLGGGPASTSRAATEAVIGSAGAIDLPGERFCHPREAAIRCRDGRLWLHDFEAGNGVFLRIKAPVRARAGRRVRRRRPAPAHRAQPRPARRARPRSHVLLLVAQVALVVPRRADLRGRRAGRVRPRARHDAADRLVGRRLRLPERPAGQRAALPHRGAGRRPSSSPTWARARASSSASRASRSSSTATSSSSAARACRSRCSAEAGRSRLATEARRPSRRARAWRRAPPSRRTRGRPS